MELKLFGYLLAHPKAMAVKAKQHALVVRTSKEDPSLASTQGTRTKGFSENV